MLTMSPIVCAVSDCCFPLDAHPGHRTGTGSSASSSGASSSHHQSQPGGGGIPPTYSNSNSNNGSGTGSGGGRSAGYIQPYQPNSRMRHSSSISSSSEFTSVSQQIPGGNGHLIVPPTMPTGLMKGGGGGGAGSHSGSDKEPDRVSGTARSRRTSGGSAGSRGAVGMGRGGAVGGRGPGLGVAGHLAQSRESFQQALDNPCTYFVGIM